MRDKIDFCKQRQLVDGTRSCTQLNALLELYDDMTKSGDASGSANFFANLTGGMPRDPPKPKIDQRRGKGLEVVVCAQRRPSGQGVLVDCLR